MDTILHPQTIPLTITDAIIPDAERRIVMQCHDKIFKSVTVLDSAGSPLYTSSSKGGVRSWSWRRRVRDGSGAHVFDLRKKVVVYGIKNKWVVDSPSGWQICDIRYHSLFSPYTALDITVQNEADKSVERIVEVRPKEKSARTTLVCIDGEAVAEIRSTEANDVFRLKNRDRSVWQARVAGGVYEALVRQNGLGRRD